MAFPVTLLDVIITTAVTAVVTTQVNVGSNLASLNLRADFDYGSAGTNGKFWIQTSFDGGTTWTDISCFAVTTASLDRYTNLSTLTPVVTPVALVDGALADNTSADGALGGLIRVKYTTTGTYATSTRIRIYAWPKHFNNRL